MIILVDTNILIPLETPNNIIDDPYVKFVKLCSEYSCKIFIHQANLDDLNRYQNLPHKQIIKSRIRKYPQLQDMGEPPQDFLASINSKHDTPQVRADDRLLYALARNAAQIFVTEDNGIINKAKLIGLDFRVYRLDQAIEFLQESFEPIPAQIPNIIDLNLYQINREDEIFNYLLNDYPGFYEWFDKKSR